MLKSLEIENYRSCRSTKLLFDETVSALVGKNGVGKTNILKCIEWLAELARPSGPIRVETYADDKVNDSHSVRAL